MITEVAEMVSSAVVDGLLRFDGGGEWLFSVYVPYTADRNPLALQNAFKGLLKDMTAGLVSQAAAEMEELERWLRQIRVGDGQGLALFACPGRGWTAAYALPEVLPARAVASRRFFYTIPLLRLLDRRRPGVGLLVGRTQSRLFRGDAGRLEEIAKLESDVPQNVREGGWRMYEEKRIDHHILEHLHAHLKESVAPLESLVREQPGTWLVIGGSDEARALIGRWLSQAVRERLLGFIDLPVDAPAEEFSRRARALEDVRKVENEARLIVQVLDASHQGKVAIGLTDVAAAAVRGAVDTLIIDEGFSAAGWMCASCGMVLAEEASTAAGICPNCQGQTFDPCREVDEALARQVITQQGRLTFTHGHKEFTARTGGVAARLRY